MQRPIWYSRAQTRRASAKGAVLVEVLLVMTIIFLLITMTWVSIVVPNQVITRNRFPSAPPVVTAGQATTFLYVIEQKKRKASTWTRLSGRQTTFVVSPSANMRITHVNAVGQGTQDPDTGVWTGVTSATAPTDTNGAVRITVITDHVGWALVAGLDVLKNIREIHDFRSTP